MKQLAALVLVPTLILGSASEGGSFNWLVGCWVTTDKSAQEVWVIDNDGALAGFGVAVEDNTVVFYEVLSIKPSANGTWAYTAHPSGQTSTSFEAVDIGDNHVIFRNPDHDYPQEISYRRDGQQLFATISLLGGQNPTSFDKVACEKGVLTN